LPTTSTWPTDSRVELFVSASSGGLENLHRAIRSGGSPPARDGSGGEIFYFMVAAPRTAATDHLFRLRSW